MNRKNKMNRDDAEKAVLLANLANGIFSRKIVRPGMVTNTPATTNGSITVLSGGTVVFCH